MKKISLILLALLFTACSGGPSTEESISQEVDETLEVKDESETEEENPKDEDKALYDINEAWAACYKDILENKLPYITFADWEGKNVEKYLNNLYGEGDLSFAIYDHKDFSYPLLILRYKLGGFSPYEKVYAIVYYQEDGSYKTFSDLDPGQFTQFSNGIYENLEGDLFIDDVSNEDIFALNKIGEDLLVNYCYRPGAKGFASRHNASYYEDGDEVYLDEEYINGSPGLWDVSLFEDRSEDFSEDAYNEFKNSLREIPMLDLNQGNLELAFGKSEDDSHGLDERQNGEDYGALIRDFDDSEIFKLNIDDKDLGQIGILNFDDASHGPYLDVGYLNSKLVKFWRAEDYSDDGALAEIDGSDPSEFVKKFDGGFYYGVFPGAMEFDYEYNNKYDVTMFSIYDFTEEEDIYTIKHPEETVVFDEDKVFIDLETLSKLFGFTYEIDEADKKLSLDTISAVEENPFTVIPTAPYASLDELLEDNFGPSH